MELRGLGGVIAGRAWLILLSGIIVGSISYYASALATPVYSASAILQIEEGADPLRDPYGSVLTTERLAKTYVEMIQGTNVLSKVVEALDLSFSASRLAGMVKAEQISQSQLIRIRVEDGIPLRGKEIANRIADEFSREIKTRQIDSYKSGKEDVDRQIGAVEKRMEATQTAMAALGDLRNPRNVDVPEFVRLELMRLENILTRDRALYVMLLRSAEDTRMSEARLANSLRVASYAELPSSPVRPLVWLNTIGGALAGLVLGLIASSLLDYADSTIKTAKDVEQLLGLYAMGNIVQVRGIRSPKRGLLTNVGERSPLVEAYRILRTNIEFCVVDGLDRTLMVSSPGPGEGKTTISTNLGIVIAQSGKRVIIVDADLRRPAVHRFFELSNATGLTTLLAGGGRCPTEALVDSGVPDLRILTSGPIPPNPAELLASEKMRLLLNELKAEADVVIVDTPPVLAVTDAGIIASQVDGLLLVLDTRKTRMEESRRAVEALKRVDARILGVVLNRHRSRGRGGYYHYYYRPHSDGQKPGHPDKPVAA
ncbi:MAG: polysaccharide biosynthesis tyrosine autokinase [Chloroflexi bacterium]|nr:polysaccharide biosynthesis tyrosine autokinase [Chloroflexota bacterium]